MTPTLLNAAHLAMTWLPQAAGAPLLDANPAASAPAASATTPAGEGAAVPAAGGGGQSGMLVMMLAIVGVMIVFSVVGSRREKKKRAQMLGSIKKHDKVLTVGGIVGSVVEMKDDTVVLKVDEQTNTRITFNKSAISQLLAGSTAE
jgi:preprotein translocase subunit YajC